MRIPGFEHAWSLDANSEQSFPEKMAEVRSVAGNQNIRRSRHGGLEDGPILCGELDVLWKFHLTAVRHKMALIDQLPEPSASLCGLQMATDFSYGVLRHQHVHTIYFPEQSEVVWVSEGGR